MKTIILIGLLMVTAFPAVASLKEVDCVNAVVGEASGEPYLAKVAVAAVIRNRMSLNGIYGVHTKHHESAKVYAICRQAWLESATNDPTHGCNMFGGAIDDWYFQHKLHLQPVLTIGHTRFYRNKP